MEPDAWILILGLVVAVLLATTVGLAVRYSQLSKRVDELERKVDISTKMATAPTPAHDRQVALVVNSTKENADEAIRLLQLACDRASMPEPLLLFTTAEDAGHSMARQALDAGCDVVIAAGGDGTVRAVAAELQGTRSALGVLPLGTGNLFARNIGLPHQNLAACIDEALHGRSNPVDVVRLQLERLEGHRDEEFSLVIAGGGLDAEVMEDTREILKQRAGWLAYGEAGARHLLGRRQEVSIRLDGRSARNYRVRSVLIANCGLLQAGMELVPSARYDDGVFDAVLLTPRNALDWGRIMAKTVLRLSTEIPIMTVRQASTGHIRMADPLPFQVDGDAVGEVIGVVAEVLPGALAVKGVQRRITGLTNEAPQIPAAPAQR